MNDKPQIEITNRFGDVVAVLSSDAGYYLNNVLIWSYACHAGIAFDYEKWNTYAHHLNQSEEMKAVVFDKANGSTRANITDSTGAYLVVLDQAARHHIPLVVGMVGLCESGGFLDKARWNDCASQLNQVEGVKAVVFDLNTGEVSK